MVLIFNTVFMLIVLSCYDSPAKVDTNNANKSENKSENKAENKSGKKGENKSVKKSAKVTGNPYRFSDPKTFDINDIKVLKYFANIMSTEQTLKAYGGFYKPVAHNAETMMVNVKVVDSKVQGPELVSPPEKLEYQNEKKFVKIVVQGLSEDSKSPEEQPLTGQYIVREVKKEAAQLDMLREMYRRTLTLPLTPNPATGRLIPGTIMPVAGENKADDVEKAAKEELKGKSFHIHNYNAYKKNKKSPVIFGHLISIKNDVNKLVSIRGNLMIELWKEKRGSPIIITFGKDKEALVLDGNNIAKRGRLSIILLNEYYVTYEGSVRHSQFKDETVRLQYKDIDTMSIRNRYDYDLATLSPKEKKQLKALNLFTIE